MLHPRRSRLLAVPTRPNKGPGNEEPQVSVFLMPVTRLWNGGYWQGSPDGIEWESVKEDP